MKNYNTRVAFAQIFVFIGIMLIISPIVWWLVHDTLTLMQFLKKVWWCYLIATILLITADVITK